MLTGSTSFPVGQLYSRFVQSNKLRLHTKLDHVTINLNVHPLQTNDFSTPQSQESSK
jgi:hypothetical protein